MPIRNNHWYNTNQLRPYPIDDSASAVSDSGVVLPAAFFKDLKLRWPTDYGQYAFLSAATSSSQIVTFLIEVAQDLDNSANDAVLIAGLTIPRSQLDDNRTYTLTTFKPYVAGFVCLGADVDQAISMTFSSPRQSLLTARAARSIRRPPVPTIGVQGVSRGLSGLVRLNASAPLEIVKGTRNIAGEEYTNVAIFRLVEQPQQQTSVFSEYAGPCGSRVGSRSCPDPQPIETINGIYPDCNGVLTLNFGPNLYVGKNVTDCGAVVDLDLGLSATCQPPYLPDLVTGLLPIETPPRILTPPVTPEPPVGPDVSISETVTTILSLPYCDTFDDAVAHGFTPVGNSIFSFISDDSPDESVCCSGVGSSYGCDVSESLSVSGGGTVIVSVSSSYGTISNNAQGKINISLFALDVQTVFRKYTTDLKVVKGLTGSYRNAGIVLNYRLDSKGLANYILCLLNIDDSTFGVYYFNGATLITLSRQTVLDLKTSDWYRLEFTSLPLTGHVNLIATLTGVTDPTITVTINTSISANLYQYDSGVAGLYANRSKSYFSFWRVDQVTP